MSLLALEGGGLLLQEGGGGFLIETAASIVAPTFLAERMAAEVWNATTNPKVSAAFDAIVGDVLVDCIADENFGSASLADVYETTNSQGALTWTKTTPALSADADTFVQIGDAYVDAAKTGMTVTATRAAGDAGNQWGHNVLHFRGSTGIGARATSATAQSVAITTQSANSSIVVIVVDWSAGDWGAATRPWVAIPGAVAPVEQSYARQSGLYTVGVARYPSSDGVGLKTVGLTGLTGTFACVAVEVKGS